MNTIVSYWLGFLFNLTIAIFIVRVIYHPMNRGKNNIFTFITFNTVIFFVISLLTTIDLSIGVGFGLFALFSILRYRTDPMSVRDMTYLFIILSLPVMNSIMFNAGLYAKLFIANLCIVAITYILEKGYGFEYEQMKEITYEKIDLIKPENHALLLEDLQTRTGIENILRFEIGSIDFLRDSTNITIYFKERKAMARY